MSEHDHDHSHASITNGDEPAAAARARALEELLVGEEVPPDARTARRGDRGDDPTAVQGGGRASRRARLGRSAPAVST